ncbi:class I SAM-dependent methyltransferase [Anaerocolumna jejuensis]|uniref:class I SAM-dependent methyltransferase n=1 Tax=Anaerocolumna jejuensis TaxID=259063 RepID=UPI003F7B8786
MANYIDGNKVAWEEAFEHRHPNWGDENYVQLKNERLPFFNPDVRKILLDTDFTGKCVAQFCCNNGRELLSLMQLGAENGVGFDIAENIIAQAVETAKKADIKNCKFEACNILDISSSYYNSFDFVIFTIGAITWFEVLSELFDIVGKCLKPNGRLLLNDFHPLMNMLPLPGEDSFDGDKLNKLTYSYFRKEPWIENNGMGYMSKEYNSKTFTSYSHTMADIINSLSENRMKTIHLNENDYDIGFTEVYNGKGFPLSFTLIAEKS